jgi:hypothetical protein
MAPATSAKIHHKSTYLTYKKTIYNFKSQRVKITVFWYVTPCSLADGYEPLFYSDDGHYRNPRNVGIGTTRHHIPYKRIPIAKSSSVYLMIALTVQRVIDGVNRHTA